MDTEDKYFFQRLDEYIEKALIINRYKMISFLNMATQSSIRRYLDTNKNIYYRIFGGYENAERNILFIIPQNYDLQDYEIHSYISAIKIVWDTRYYSLTHRDILGSIMSLGIKRENIGDILINHSDAIVFCLTTISEFINNSLLQIKSTKVNTEIVDIDSIEIPQTNVDSQTITAASNRIDCVLSSSFGLSRNAAQDFLKGEKVFINWVCEKKKTRSVSPGDVITLRGKGRIIVNGFIGKTKKGRVKIAIDKYI